MSSSIEPRVLPLAGSLSGPLLWLLLIGAVPVLIGLGVMSAVASHSTTNAAAHGTPAVVFLAPAILCATLLLIATLLSRANVRIEGRELFISTGIASERISLSSLRGAGLQIVNLDAHGELAPVRRTLGVVLPGYSGGWFRLRNGETALCLLLDRRRVTYLRSTNGTSLLLSLAHPEQLRLLLERESA